ncbi:hypothetical protein V6N13_053860 [Hibiscus sabdariffa]
MGVTTRREVDMSIINKNVAYMASKPKKKTKDVVKGLGSSGRHDVVIIMEKQRPYSRSMGGKIVKAKGLSSRSSSAKGFSCENC